MSRNNCKCEVLGLLAETILKANWFHSASIAFMASRGIQPEEFDEYCRLNSKEIEQVCEENLPHLLRHLQVPESVFRMICFAFIPEQEPENGKVH